MRMINAHRTATALVHRTASALVIAALAFPAAALAQATPGATPAAPPAAMPATPVTPPAATPAKPAPHAAARQARRRMSPTDRVEQRITQLHDELKITPAEQPQWDAFAGVMRSNATSATQAYIDRAGKVAGMSAADNMMSYAQLTMQHAQDLQKLATAFQSLYGALTPDQQKLADQAFRGAATRHRG